MKTGRVPPGGSASVMPSSGPTGMMSSGGSGMPPMLQRLMSNPGGTLEEIERQQRGEIPRYDFHFF